MVRYLKLTILSSYGNWKYFTLSQIKVYGSSLFSHALETLLKSSLPNGTVPENLKKIFNHSQ